MTNGIMSAASQLAELGFPVFPCAPGDKRPATEHGCKDATCDIGTVEATFNQNPAYNIGLATDRLMLVDIDPIDGRQNPWLDADRMAALTVDNPPVANTPRGGHHFYFRQPDGANIRNSASKIAPGIDVRGNGGYVVAPGSVTPTGRYEWVVPPRPVEDLPLPPQWLLDALQTPKPRGNLESTWSAPASPVADGGPIPNGSRNDSLFRLAGAMRAKGMGESEIVAALLVTNRERCNPPLPDDEVETIAKSIGRYPPGGSVDFVHGAAASGQPAPAVPRRDPPKIQSIGDLVDQHPTLRTPVIDNLLRQGEVMNVIAKSKVGKSWLAYGLALCVRAGMEWLGIFRCTPGRVLLIDNELHPEDLAHRIPTVAYAMRIEKDTYREGVDVLSLRGNLLGFDALHETLAQIERNYYSLIICDAFYRMLPPGMSENDNAAMAHVYNRIDWFTAMTGAAWVLIHHSTKGDQSGKDVVDVGAGAGSQSRAADTHLIIRPHQESDCAVVDVAVRSFKPVDSIAVRWCYPLWMLDENLDPALLKGRKDAQTEDARKKRFDDKRERVVKYLVTVLSSGATKSAIRDHTGISVGLGEVIDGLVADGTVVSCEVESTSNKSKYTGFRLAAPWSITPAAEA